MPLLYMRATHPRLSQKVVWCRIFLGAVTLHNHYTESSHGILQPEHSSALIFEFLSYYNDKFRVLFA